MVAAITAHPGPLQGCDTIPLGALRYRATASPGFARCWFPGGPTAEALAHAPALVYSREDRLQHRWTEGLTGRRLTMPAHMLASSQGFVDAALAGLGWGMNPEPLVAAHIAAGRLVDLAPAQPLDVALHWQFTRLAAPTLAPLTQAVRLRQPTTSCPRPLIFAENQPPPAKRNPARTAANGAAGPKAGIKSCAAISSGTSKLCVTA